jgi:hypothetical protein
VAAAIGYVGLPEADLPNRVGEPVRHAARRLAAALEDSALAAAR